MKLYKIIEMIDDLFYRKYDSLRKKSWAEKIIVKRNTINNEKISAGLLVLEGNIRFVNKGDFKGVILAKNADIYNFGLIEGVIFTKNGKCSFKENSRTSGLVYSESIALQPGCIIEGELFFKDKRIFIEKLKQTLPNYDANNIIQAIEIYCR